MQVPPLLPCKGSGLASAPVSIQLVGQTPQRNFSAPTSGAVCGKHFSLKSDGRSYTSRNQISITKAGSDGKKSKMQNNGNLHDHSHHYGNNMRNA